MVVLHKLNDEEFILNSSHIEIIEERPDTIITLTNDKKYIVKESRGEVLDMIVNYKKQFLL